MHAGKRFQLEAFEIFEPVFIFETAFLVNLNYTAIYIVYFHK